MLVEHAACVADPGHNLEFWWGSYCLCASVVYGPDWMGINLKRCGEEKGTTWFFSNWIICRASCRRARADPASDGSALSDANRRLSYLTSQLRPLAYEDSHLWKIHESQHATALFVTHIFDWPHLRVSLEKKWERQTQAAHFPTRTRTHTECRWIISYGVFMKQTN